jgi:hypothetical protein
MIVEQQFAAIMFWNLVKRAMMETPLAVTGALLSVLLNPVISALTDIVNMKVIAMTDIATLMNNSSARMIVDKAIVL